MRILIVLLILTLTSCGSNVERISNDSVVIYDQPSPSQPERPIIVEPVQDAIQPLNTTPFEAGDESIYPFADKRLRKHDKYLNSVLIEEKNKWGIELLRIVQNVDIWTISDEDYRVSTALAVGKNDGSLIVWECNYVDEDVTEAELENVKQRQMNEVKAVMKKLAYKLNKLN